MHVCVDARLCCKTPAMASSMQDGEGYTENLRGTHVCVDARLC